jgi:hypothetical protein
MDGLFYDFVLACWDLQYIQYFMFVWESHYRFITCSLRVSCFVLVAAVVTSLTIGPVAHSRLMRFRSLLTLTHSSLLFIRLCLEIPRSENQNSQLPFRMLVTFLMFTFSAR